MGAADEKVLCPSERTQDDIAPVPARNVLGDACPAPGRGDVEPSRCPAPLVDPSGLGWQVDVPLGLEYDSKLGPKLSGPHHRIPNGCCTGEVGEPWFLGADLPHIGRVQGRLSTVSWSRICLVSSTNRNSCKVSE